MTRSASEELICPFCHEPGFDVEGLDRHLHMYCEKYGGLHAQATRIRELETVLEAAHAALSARAHDPNCRIVRNGCDCGAAEDFIPLRTVFYRLKNALPAWPPPREAEHAKE